MVIGGECPGDGTQTCGGAFQKHRRNLRYIPVRHQDSGPFLANELTLSFLACRTSLGKNKTSSQRTELSDTSADTTRSSELEHALPEAQNAVPQPLNDETATACGKQLPETGNKENSAPRSRTKSSSSPRRKAAKEAKILAFDAPGAAWFGESASPPGRRRPDRQRQSRGLRGVHDMDEDEQTAEALRLSIEEDEKRRADEARVEASKRTHSNKSSPSSAPRCVTERVPSNELSPASAPKETVKSRKRSALESDDDEDQEPKRTKKGSENKARRPMLSLSDEDVQEVPAANQSRSDGMAALYAHISDSENEEGGVQKKEQEVSPKKKAKETNDDDCTSPLKFQGDFETLSASPVLKGRDIEYPRQICALSTTHKDVIIQAIKNKIQANKFLTARRW